MHHPACIRTSWTGLRFVDRQEKSLHAAHQARGPGCIVCGLRIHTIVAILKLASDLRVRILHLRKHLIVLGIRQLRLEHLTPQVAQLHKYRARWGKPCCSQHRCAPVYAMSYSVAQVKDITGSEGVHAVLLYAMRLSWYNTGRRYC